MLSVTRSGICTISDSAYYIMAARTLLTHRTFGILSPDGQVTPLTIWPPLYSAVLASLNVFGLDPVVGARWLHAFLFGMNISMVGWLVRKATNGSFWFALTASVLFMSSAHLLSIHWLALTEPLFIFFLLFCLYLLLSYIQKSQVRWLIAAAVAASLAWLTRYSGASLVLTGILAIIRLGRAPFSQRIVHAVVFMLMSSFPAALWMIRNKLAAGTATSKHLAWHPVSLSLLREYLHSIALLILPNSFGPAVMAAVGLLGLCLLLALNWRRRPRHLSFYSHQYLFLLFLLCYMSLIFISISFFDANLAQDTWRLLLPAYIVGLAGTLSVTQRLCESMASKRSFRAAAIALVLLYVGAFLYSGAAWVINSDSGEPADIANTNYTSKFWTRSKLIQEVRTLPMRTPIYTNGPDALYILTGRVTYSLPYKFSADTQQSNPTYADALLTIKDGLRQGGVLVYLKTHQFSNAPSRDELEEYLSLHLVTSDPVGFIYESKNLNIIAEKDK